MGVQAACLPEATTTVLMKEDEAWIVGWGSLFEGGPMTDWLRNVRIRVYDGDSHCQDVVKEYFKNWNLQICAGYFLFNYPFIYLPLLLSILSKQ